MDVLRFRLGGRFRVFSPLVGDSAIRTTCCSQTRLDTYRHANMNTYVGDSVCTPRVLR